MEIEVDSSKDLEALGASKLNDKTITDIIEVLFENIKDKSEGLNILSRKTILDFSNNYLSIVIKVGIDVLSSILNNTTNNAIFIDWLESYTSLFMELIDKHGKFIYDKGLSKSITVFVIETIRSYLDLKPSQGGKEAERFKTIETRTLIICGLIKRLAEINFKDVLNEILTLFNPGSIPHKFIIELLSNLAETFANKVLFNYTEVISRLLPILSSIKDENVRVVFCKLFGVIAEGVILTIDNQSLEVNTQIKSSLDAISPLFVTAFDLIQAQWLQCLKYSNKVAVVNCLILFGSLLPENSLSSNIDNIINIYTTNLKKDCFEESLMLTKSLRCYLDLVINRYGTRLETFVSPLLILIFPILTSPLISPNAKEFNPQFAKLKSELLQIISALFTQYLDKTFTFLISRFEAVSLIEKLADIYVIKTLLIRTPSVSTSYRDMLLAAVSKATHESDLEIRFALIDLIMVLFEKGLNTPESSIKMISFLIKESGHTDEDIEKSKDIATYPFITTLKQIRERADTILLEIVNKVENSHLVIWPHILEYLVDSKYNGSNYTILRVILACKIVIDLKGNNFCLTNENGVINPSIPSASQILIKLFIILADPNKRSGLSQSTIQSIKYIFPILHPDLKSVKPDLSEIESYLKRGKFYDENSYYDVMVIVWERLLGEIKNGELMSSVTESLLEYLNNGNKDFKVTSFVIRLFGIVLSNLGKREAIKNHLNSIFSYLHPEFKHDVINANIPASNPQNSLRAGVAEAFGLASKTNLDVVLDKVNAIFKSEIQQAKPSGFSALFSSAKDPSLSPQIKTSLIVILGKIAKYTKPSSLSPRIESNFMSYIDLYYKEESAQLKQACLLSMGNVFHSLHKLSSSYIEAGSDLFILSSRDSYLNLMVDIFNKERGLSEFKSLALLNIGYLTQLDPPISLEKAIVYVKLAFSVFDIKEINNKSEASIRAIDSALGVFNFVQTHESHSLFSATSSIEILKKDNPVLLKNEPLLNYSKDNYSSWDIFTLVMEELLSRYIEADLNQKAFIFEQIEFLVNQKKTVKFNTKEEQKSWIVNLIILLLICFDECPTLERESVLLCITRLLTGVNSFGVSHHLKTEELIAELVKVVDGFEKLEIFFFTQKLFALLRIENINVTKWTCLLINSIVSSKSSVFVIDDNKDKNLKSEAECVLQLLISSLEAIIQKDSSCDSPRVIETLKVAELFTNINLSSFINACLDEKYGLPLPLGLATILQRIGKDENKIKIIFSIITEILNNEHPGTENKPRYDVCASTVILGTIFVPPQEQNQIVLEKINKFFPQLLSTLILRIGSAHSINYTVNNFACKEADPRNQTVWAMQRLLKYSPHDEISGCLENGGSIHRKLMLEYEYDEGIYELMMICCLKIDHSNQEVMFEFMKDFLERPWSGQRVVSITCIAQFLYYSSPIKCKNQEFDLAEWRSSLIKELIKALSDSDELARKMSIRGLANLTTVYLESCSDMDAYIKLTENRNGNLAFNIFLDEADDDYKEKLKFSIKSQMLDDAYNKSLQYIIDKITDTSESVVTESLKSLQQMIEYLSIKVLTPYMTNLLMKLRPCFDNQNHQIRSLSFSLFYAIQGLLSNTDSYVKDPRLLEIIKEQTSNHLVSFILHSADEALMAKKHSLKCLHRSIKILCDVNSEEIYTKLKETNAEEATFDLFIEKLSEIVYAHYPKKIPYHILNLINHSHSSQENIRASSANMIGILFSLIWKSNDEETLKQLSLDQIYVNFTKLLKDYSAKVKVKTVKAFKYFKDIHS